MNQYTLSLVSLAASLACSVPAHADPLSLKLSETVTYDTNYARNTSDDAEVVSSTGIALGLNKSYGRQNYSASGKFGIDKHKNFKEQDNNNYELSGGFVSEIASNWAVALNGSTSEKLNSVENNPLNNRLAKNMVRSHAAGMNLQYGVAGRWSLLGSLGMARTSYSLDSYDDYQNRKQSSGGLRLVYNTSDLLSFGLGVSTANTEYPKQIVAGVPEEIKQRSLDFTTNWQVTGFSRLDSILSYTKNKYKSDSRADFKGFTGRLNWNYKPTGVTTYSLSAARVTNNDGSGTGLRNNAGVYDTIEDYILGNIRYVDTTINSVTTSIDGRMRWTPTAKLGFTAGLGWDRYDVTTSRNVSSAGPTGKTSSDYTVVSLASDYNFSRAISVGCSIQQYKQSAESNPQVTTNVQRVGHDGRQFSCNASFTID
ncbi:hypothetical protein AQB9606_03886 [Aquabacterium sp. CECT 9606]|nr:hypothetical protein AQB9606_03886 [Aquabacterium sp. CECT 9606]